VSTPDEKLARRLAVRLLRARGYMPWGTDAWVREDEGCDTCYDTAWALETEGIFLTEAESTCVFEVMGA
jgi:hypothetical protein